jgi:hypothetical protein
MLAQIVEDVRQRVSRLPRRSDHLLVIAICEYAAAPPEDSIEGSCEPRRDRHHSLRHRTCIARLHQQVRVVLLQRVVHQPKASAIAACTERALDLLHYGGMPE